MKATLKRIKNIGVTFYDKKWEMCLPFPDAEASMKNIIVLEEQSINIPEAGYLDEEQIPKEVKIISDWKEIGRMIT